MLQIVMAHYKGERTRDYNLRQASVKNFVPFAFVCGCTNYAPLLMEILFHTGTQQRRYTQLLSDGFFTHHIASGNFSAEIDKDCTGEDVQDGSQCVYVGWDNIAENLNLHQSKARHRGQSIDQSKCQANNMDNFMEECRNMDTAAYLHPKAYKHNNKDDRSTRVAILTELIHNGSFKPNERDLTNEFDSTPLNEAILKSSWVPASDVLMKQFAREKKLCDIETMKEQLMGPHSKLLNKIKKSKSTTIKIDTVMKESKSKTDMDIEAESKKILTELRWKNSQFEDTAAVCTPSGEKINPSKSSFRHCLAKTFQHTPDEVLSHHLTSDYLQLLNSEHAKLHNISKQELVLLCPMLLNLAISFLSRKPTESRTLNSIINLRIPATLQICKQKHWITLVFDACHHIIFYLDSLGKAMPASINNTLNINFHDWTVHNNADQLQFDSYQCGVWAVALVQDYMEYLCSNNSEYVPFKALKNLMSQPAANKMDVTSTYSAVKRNEFKKLLLESSLLFMFNTKPDVKPEVVAVDAQHTLWINPSVNSGQDYLQFLNKRFWKNYFEEGFHTVYWCYDIAAEVEKLPKYNEQKRRGSQSKVFSRNAITDETVTFSDWTSAISQSRQLRNEIIDYIRLKETDCSLHAPEGCRLIMNKEYAEGEGAAAAMLLKHPNNNWLLVTNDTDGILYALLLGATRKRDGNGVFEKEFIVQLNYRSNGKGKSRKDKFVNTGTSAD